MHRVKLKSSEKVQTKGKNVNVKSLKQSSEDHITVLRVSYRLEWSSLFDVHRLAESPKISGFPGYHFSSFQIC